jgi:hypothetical protein
MRISINDRARSLVSGMPEYLDGYRQQDSNMEQGL